LRPRVLSMADVTACPVVLDSLREVAEVVDLPADAEVLRDRIEAFDAYFASLAVQVDREVLTRAKRLRVIATGSTGTDHIDLDAARQCGVTVLSLKDDREFLDRITATAELAWGLLLSVVRRLPWAFDDARKGHWSRDAFRGRQISGKTLGVIGYGRLGRMVAEYGKAFRMRVLACDTREVEMSPGVERVSLHRLLAESDVISVHVHLTEETRGLIGCEAFSQMKPGVVLINTSRGAVIDEEALLRALQQGRVAGAGLDVVHGEWREDLEQHPLIQYSRAHQNVVITPHIGGVTEESQTLAYERTVGKLADFLRGLAEHPGSRS